MNPEPCKLLPIPNLNAERVWVDLLMELPPRSKAHSGVGWHRLRSASRDSFVRRGLVREHAGFGFVDGDLQPAHQFTSSDGCFDGRTFSQRHRHKLADRAVAGIDAIQPRLLWTNQVVLRG